MSEEKNRICIFCKHYNFVPATPDYSEVTLGSDAIEYCGKNKWETDFYNDTEEDRRTNLSMAKTCKKYKFFKIKHLK